MFDRVGTHMSRLIAGVAAGDAADDGCRGHASDESQWSSRIQQRDATDANRRPHRLYASRRAARGQPRRRHARQCCPWPRRSPRAFSAAGRGVRSDCHGGCRPRSSAFTTCCGGVWSCSSAFAATCRRVRTNCCGGAATCRRVRTNCCGGVWSCSSANATACRRVRTNCGGGAWFCTRADAAACGNCRHGGYPCSRADAAAR